MLLSIILGLLRHALTTAGGALVASSVQFAEGLPAVQNLEHTALGLALIGAGGTLSILHKIKTVSGPDYSTLNK